MELKLELWQKVASRDDFNNNILWMENKITQAENSDILVFPELATWGSIFDGNFTTPPLEEVKKGINKLQQACKDYEKRIIFGTVYPTPDGIENRAYLLGENNIQYYTKAHVHWTEKYKEGNSFPLFECYKIPIGCLICFDIAFPEAVRILTLRGMEILFIVAATPDTFHPRYNQSRARGLAILNQIWVIYLNRCDKGFNGNSIVVNPRGDSIAELDHKMDVKEIMIDTNEVKKWREEEPAMDFRRPDLYHEITKKLKS